MENYRQTLINEMAKQGYTQSEFSLTIGISPSTLTRFLNNSRETPPDVAAKIVRHLKPEIEVEFMEKYCGVLSRPANIKLAMEYASTHRLLTLLQLLVEQGLTDRNAEVNEFAKIYSILLRYQTQNITPEELYEAVRFEKGSSEEAKVLLRILEIYSLHAQMQYGFMKASLGKLEDSIDDLSDDFFKKSYKARLSEILMIVNLKVLDKPKTARRYAKEILDAPVGIAYKASAYFIIGQSFMFENVDKYVKYYSKSKRLYSKMKSNTSVANIEDNIQFGKLLWGIEVDEFKTDQKVKAYDHIKKGEIEIGLSIIEGLEAKDASLDPIRSYIKGEATNNPRYYWESMQAFRKRGDKFLSNLPKIKLLTLQPENEIIINSFFE